MYSNEPVDVFKDIKVDREKLSPKVRHSLLSIQATVNAGHPAPPEPVRSTLHCAICNRKITKNLLEHVRSNHRKVVI